MCTKPPSKVVSVSCFKKDPDQAHTSHPNSAEVLGTVWNDKEEEYTREEMKEMTRSSGEGAEKKNRDCVNAVEKVSASE